MKSITKDLLSPRKSTEKTNEVPDLLPILYVEDDKTNFDIAERILSTQFQVTWAKSPDEARAHLKSNLPALILLDIEFSGHTESGLDFLSALRSRHINTTLPVQGLPVVILSASSASYDQRELRSYGADGAIFKPIDPEELISICHTLAHRSFKLGGAAHEEQRLKAELADLKEQLEASQIAYETTNKIMARATQRLAEAYQSRSDLTAERDALQKEIQLATKELIQADRLATLGSLVAGVAHDITNPTNLIAMNKEVLYTHLRELESVISELLKDATGPEAEILFEMFKKVFHNSHEALSEITLGLDRIYAINQAIRKQSRRDDEKTEFVVHELLKECITIVKARSKAVELKLTGDESTEFIAYRSHLGQVIMNLLSNGIDAAEEFVRADESSPEVVLGFKRRSDHLNLWIQDNGPGVPEDLREEIFTPFFTTKPSGKGTGLGMPIIMKIVSEHNGRIELAPYSEFAGARFDIYLPLPEEDESNP